LKRTAIGHKPKKLNKKILEQKTVIQTMNKKLSEGPSSGFL